MSDIYGRPLYHQFFEQALGNVGAAMERRQSRDLAERNYAQELEAAQAREAYQQGMLGVAQEREAREAQAPIVAGNVVLDPTGTKILHQAQPKPELSFEQRLQLKRTGPPKAGGSGLPPSLTKMLYETENLLPSIDNTISQFERALEINPNTFEGLYSKKIARAITRDPTKTLAEILPGLGITEAGYVQKALQEYGNDDPETLNARAMATDEWENIMGKQATATLSRELKGATTWPEIQLYLDRIANPDTPRVLREKYITTTIDLLKKERAVKAKQIEELRRRESGEGDDEGEYEPEVGDEAENPETGETVIWDGNGWVKQ